MTTIITTTLILHVIFGVIGTMAIYGVWLGLIKKVPSIRYLKYASLLTFVSFVLSWFSGGYYYVVYYGGNVKPKIISGAYPWAHKIVTEAKEHVFLFVPFLAFVLLVTVWSMGDKLLANETLKRKITSLAGVVTVVAVLITISGIIMSGSVR